MDNKDEIYERLWKDEVYPCLVLIEDHLYEEVFTRYQHTIIGLKRKYLLKEMT
jgi:hypothetical protein